MIPNHIPARPPCIEQIEISVAVHVDGAKVVGLLILIEDMTNEITFPVVLIPGDDFALVPAGGPIEVAITVEICDTGCPENDGGPEAGGPDAGGELTAEPIPVIDESRRLAGTSRRVLTPVSQW